MVKRFLQMSVLASVAAGAATAAASDDPAELYADEGYSLVWADEFDVDGRPNPANWIYETGFTRNEEAQWYQPDNARVENGRLIIEARRERVPNPGFRAGARGWRESRRFAEYTSACLKSRGKHSWTYGRFEMRGKIDVRAGLWPAWWTVGEPDRPGIGWPASGEIDMMEYYRGTLLANACWKAAGGGRWNAEWDSTKTPIESLGDGWADEFHTWRMDWDEDSIELYVDGMLLNSIDTTKTINPDGTNPFQWPHFMLVNVAVGGQQGGDPSSTEFPSTFEVDWIRVYQKSETEAHASGQTTADQPNVVLIVADDMGYADAGFMGSEEIRTPNIDRIAFEGVRFTDGYVTGAVCGPSRAGLITGRYQDRFGCSNNPTVDPTIPNGIPLDQPMLPELLSAAGYTTMAVGKWHLGTYEGMHPRDRGFDEFYGFLTGGHDYFPENLTLDDLSEVDRKWAWYRTKLLHNGKRVATDAYLTDELADAAVEFIDRDHDRPFFVYLAFNAPHTPMQATSPYLQRFEHIQNPRRRTYAAMMSAMDDGIGRVLETLERRGVSDDTLVVFLSDNSGARNNASLNAPLRGHKGSLNEGGIRVPFAMRWPDQVPAGIVFEAPMYSLDITATAVTAAGPRAQNAVPEDRPLDGNDLLPFLRGERVASCRPNLISD